MLWVWSEASTRWLANLNENNFRVETDFVKETVVEEELEVVIGVVGGREWLIGMGGWDSGACHTIH